ncbi:ATP-grasp domain-containing protein, partial [Methylibium sp. T29]|uniref:ATP-grasp domain-containing protein n=1 Tax=Methylibium sp. T29 TaxID=1430884 RepID=UPI0012697BB7
MSSATWIHGAPRGTGSRSGATAHNSGSTAAHARGLARGSRRSAGAGLGRGQRLRGSARAAGPRRAGAAADRHASRDGAARARPGRLLRHARLAGPAAPRGAVRRPDPPSGWLRKEARGTGGWHIRPADDPHPADPEQQPYYQREAPGTPMSALFLANGREARVLGISELIVRPLGAHHPHVYRGAIGPVALPAALAVGLDTTLHTLVAAFGLRGLCSLDFLLDGDHWSLLEINPRPSASAALYGDHLAWMRAHVGACLQGTLPSAETA